MSDPKHRPSAAPDSGSDRDPLDVTDLPEKDADGTDVKGGGEYATGSGLSPTPTARAKSTLPSTQLLCPPSSTTDCLL